MWSEYLYAAFLPLTVVWRADTGYRTLRGMFPNLDKEVIEDVVRAQEGNVGRAVDACLALNG